MTGKQVLQMAKQLADNQEFRHYRDLPLTFVEEAATLSDDEVLELAVRLWQLRDFRFLVAAATVIERHPSALRRVRWEVLEPIGNLMDSWGAVDMFACLAGPAWRARQVSDARVLRWTRSKRCWWLGAHPQLALPRITHHGLVLPNNCLQCDLR